MDAQTQFNVIEGGWRYSDPCPILSVDWSVQQLGGPVVVNETSIINNPDRRFYHDGLELENLKT